MLQTEQIQIRHYLVIYLYFWFFLSMKIKCHKLYISYWLFSLNSWNTFRMKHIQVCPFYEILLIRCFYMRTFLKPHVISYEHITGAMSFIWNCYHFIWNLFMICNLTLYQKCCKWNNNRYVVYPEIYLFFWFIYPWK